MQAITNVACIAAEVTPLHGSGTAGLALKLSESVSEGRLLLEVRPRHARITESAKPEKTDAWTVRTILGWQSAPYHDMRLTAQYIHTGILRPANLNADPAKLFSSPYPLLPDPAHSGINQFFVDYAGMPSTRLRVGRQILRIDDERFVSDMDFRQTPQLFDGVTLINTALQETEIQLGEYRRRRTVLGGSNRLRLRILHAGWNPLPDHTLAGYGYWHDQAATGSQTGFAHNAQRIIGVHAEGSVPVGDTWRWTYHLGYARQNRIGDGDARINARYSRIGMGMAHTGASMWGIRLDHEIKGSDGGAYGFQTPLSDFYAFNGWALQYTSTPPQGLRDTWVTLRGRVERLEIFAEGHRFRSDFGSVPLGREFDLGVTYTLDGNLALKLQYAQFTPGADARVKNDVEKTWLTLIYAY